MFLQIIKQIVKTCNMRLLKILSLSHVNRKIHTSAITYSNTKSRADFRMAPNVFRQKHIYSAIVKDIFDASSTIKILRLYIKEPGFSFKAGQWVDFFVPGITDVTGYSMTSAPTEAKENGVLELSVKYGKFPPTQWVHNVCREGVEVHIRVGGDFYYDPLSLKSDAESNLLLIGGGVGINPLVSILCEYRDFLLSNQIKKQICPGKVHLLYSAKTDEELVFRDTFSMIEKEHPTLSCQYFVTKKPLGRLDERICYSRIREEDIKNSMNKLEMEKTLCYICGPSTMTDDFANYLLKIGVKKEQIRFEKWW